MNRGRIYIDGNTGDATGYAMRGGRIVVRGDAGYRAGIHMKAYQDKLPVLVVGGRTGSFLGEYQAGGIIIVLGMDTDGAPPVGAFTGTGMHGGKIFLRCEYLPDDLPSQVTAWQAKPADLEEIREYLEDYSAQFHRSLEEILSRPFYVLSPNSQNPYKQLYTYN